MLDSQIPVVDERTAIGQRPVVSYENKRGTMSGKGALFGAAAGFGYSIVRGKSKLLWTIIGAVIGSSVESVINRIKK